MNVSTRASSLSRLCEKKTHILSLRLRSAYQVQSFGHPRGVWIAPSLQRISRYRLRRILTTSAIKCSGAAHSSLSQRKTLMLKEQLRSMNLTDRVNKLLELTIHAPGDQTIQDNHSTECSRAATFADVGNLLSIKDDS